jgi:hypothetical protein
MEEEINSIQKNETWTMSWAATWLQVGNQKDDASAGIWYKARRVTNKEVTTSDFLPIYDTSFFLIQKTDQIPSARWVQLLRMKEGVNEQE